MVAPTASMNPTVVTTGPEFGLDLGRSISAVSEHIIAGVARVQQLIQLLAVVHGSIGHGIMPDQLVLGVRVHMVLVAEEAAAMLLGPARIAVLLPLTHRRLCESKSHASDSHRSGEAAIFRGAHIIYSSC